MPAIKSDRPLTKMKGSYSRQHIRGRQYLDAGYQAVYDDTIIVRRVLPQFIVAKGIAGGVTGFGTSVYATKSNESHSEQMDLSEMHDVIVNDEYLEPFLRSIKNDDFDSGKTTGAERIVATACENREYAELELLLKNACEAYKDDSMALVNLCRCMEPFEEKYFGRSGADFLRMALSDKDDEVKAAALSLAGNWQATDMLDIIRNMKCKEKWLEDFRQEIRDYLEDV